MMSSNENNSIDGDYTLELVNCNEKLLKSGNSYSKL